jgi:hypothetical protein
LAAKPDESKLMAWVEVVKNPAESDRFRCVALAGLFTKLHPMCSCINHLGSKPDELSRVFTKYWPHDSAAGAADARNLLRKIWNDPQSNLSLELLTYLDYVLRGTDRKFEDSDDRRDVWLKKLLTLAPERKKDDNNIDQLARSILCDLARTQPGATGQRLAAELPNKEWPPGFRAAIAAGLLSAYEHADRVDPAWEPPIQTYLIGSMEEGEPLPIYFAAAAVEYFAGAKASGSSETKRFYVPDAKVKAAMRLAFDRMTTASVRPGADRMFGGAAGALADVIKTFDDPAHR